MKFGKQLLLRMKVEWRDEYVQYSNVKNLVKTKGVARGLLVGLQRVTRYAVAPRARPPARWRADMTAEAFVARLRRRLARLSNFKLSILQQCEREVTSLKLPESIHRANVRPAPVDACCSSAAHPGAAGGATGQDGRGGGSDRGGAHLA